MQIKSLPRLLAAIAVVPEPAKGSKIKSAFVDLMHLMGISKGKGAGWGFFFSGEIVHTSVSKLLPLIRENLGLAIKYITSYVGKKYEELKFNPPFLLQMIIWRTG